MRHLLVLLLATVSIHSRYAYGEDLTAGDLQPELPLVLEAAPTADGADGADAEMLFLFLKNYRISNLYGMTTSEPLQSADPSCPDTESPLLKYMKKMLRCTKAITGTASYYGPGFHGRETASGEIFDQNAISAANRTLPLGTQVKVINLKNGKEVDFVVINDRGPYVGKRVLDASKALAERLNFTDAGTTTVRIEYDSCATQSKSAAGGSRSRAKRRS